MESLVPFDNEIKSTSLMDENEDSSPFMSPKDSSSISDDSSTHTTISSIIKDPDLKDKPVSQILQPAFPFVTPNSSIEEVSAKINKKNSAVLLKDDNDRIHIITTQDIIQAIN